MTRQDDAKLNTLNPLTFRAKSHGVEPGKDGNILYVDQDQNIINLMRFAGDWDSGRATYLKNEVIRFLGGVYVANKDTTSDPVTTPADWDSLVPPMGRGAMFLSTPVLGGSLGLAWTPVQNLDSNAFTDVGCITVPAAGTFEFDYPGLWDVRFFLNFTHDESNQGRESQLRVWNVTAGAVAAGPITFGIGRNTPATTLTVSFLEPITVADVVANNVYRFEVGNGDSITVVEWESIAIEVVQLHAQ